MPSDASNPPMILIADDDPLTCHVIHIHLERAGYENLEIAHDAQETIAIAIREKPALILLDITLPDLDGLEVLSIVKSAVPDTRVLMLTGQQSSDLVTGAIAGGAVGYLIKRASDLNSLGETIDLILEGNAIIVDQRLLQRAASKAAAHLEGIKAEAEKGDELTKNLTPQELEVLKMIAAGFTNEEIGKSLYISYNTVKTHVSSIYRKLKVSDRTQAAIVALRHGIGAD